MVRRPHSGVSMLREMHVSVVLFFFQVYSRNLHCVTSDVTVASEALVFSLIGRPGLDVA